MNVQEAVRQTLDIYIGEDEYQSIDNAMDYLLQLLKVADEQRIKKAVYEAKHPKTEIADPYVSGYRAGWNDALKALGTAAAGACATALVDAANSMMRK